MIRRVTAPGPFPPPVHPHASVVEAGTRPAFLAGAVPPDADGALVDAGAPVRQAGRVLAGLEEQLRAAGSDPAHAVPTGAYVVADDPAVLAAVRDVVEASGPSAGPHASPLLGVACPGHPGRAVEITATAVVPDAAAGAR
ncbi:hypothetical protein GCM10019016_013760 [Streptomyces prasinosporus]|uniref:RidA family protein n=1 Tax=Streptomyces prasinosporus TaxID=68256 RepID=A0ABP6TII7_9ACTN